MKLLRQFIREELVWNYWLRRPRNSSGPGDVSDEIEQQRRDVFSSTKDDMQARIEQLKHSLVTASSIKQMGAAVKEFGESPGDIAADPSLFVRAARDGDVDEVRRQLTTGLEKWATETLKWSEVDDYDTSSLTGHPMRSIAAGGSTNNKHRGP